MRKRVRLNERQLHSLFYDYLEGMGIDRILKLTKN